MSRVVLSNFEDRHGLESIACNTPWGRWHQTPEEVFVEIDLPAGTKARDIKCDIRSRSLNVIVKNENIIEVSYELKCPSVSGCIFVNDKEFVIDILHSRSSLSFH